jgi:hypothetical protein
LGDPGKDNSNVKVTEMETQFGLNWSSVGFIETCTYSYRAEECPHKPKNIGFIKK